MLSIGPRSTVRHSACCYRDDQVLEIGVGMVLDRWYRVRIGRVEINLRGESKSWTMRKVATCSAHWRLDCTVEVLQL